MRTLVLLWICCGVLVGQEALPSFERLVVKGKAFQDVKVVAVEPSGIRFMHATGAGRAKFEELEEEVRAKFKFDPEEAKRYEMQREAYLTVAAGQRRIEKLKIEVLEGAKRNIELAKKKAVLVGGRVVEVTKNGVELSDAWWSEERFTRHGFPDGQVFLVCNTNGIVDGHRVEELAYPRGSYESYGRKMKCYTMDVEDYLRALADPTALPASTGRE
jgi:hypothetical protein